MESKPVQPKRMQKIYEEIVKVVGKMTPHMVITVDDNLYSNICIKGSFDAKELWTNNIFHNSRYFIISVSSSSNRWYEEGDKLKLELSSKHHKLEKLRKYTGSLEGVIERLVKYLSSELCVSVKPLKEVLGGVDEES